MRISTSSRRIEKRSSCVDRARKMRSASRPYLCSQPSEMRRKMSGCTPRGCRAQDARAHAHAVPRVWIVVLFSALLTDKVHDFVLAFARDGCVGDDHLQASPSWFLRNALLHVVAQVRRKPRHKLGARGDYVRVPWFLAFGQRVALTPLSRLLANLLPVLLGELSILCGTEAARALLVHLCARRNAVDGHVQHAPRPER